MASSSSKSPLQRKSQRIRTALKKIQRHATTSKAGKITTHHPTYSPKASEIKVTVTTPATSTRATRESEAVWHDLARRRALCNLGLAGRQACIPRRRSGGEATLQLHL